MTYTVRDFYGWPIAQYLTLDIADGLAIREAAAGRYAAVVCEQTGETVCKIWPNGIVE